MLTWLFGHSSGQAGNLFLRATLAALLSFLILMVFSPRMIRFLLRKKLGDRPEFDNAALNELTKQKSNTPTMGGLLIVGAIMVSTLLFADVGEQSMYVRMALFVLVWLGALGAIDDWFKLRRPLLNAQAAARGEKPSTRDGLRMWQKILFQIALAVLVACFIPKFGSQSTSADWRGELVNPVTNFYLPFKSLPVALSLGAFVIITMLTIVGSSNAVNLTDGMDGLASGCMLIASLVFAALAVIAGRSDLANTTHMPHVPQAQELAVVCSAMAGACLGFLWYNCQPAQVFMGDTGSLPLGGLLGYVAVVTRQEMTLFIAGGVFVMEALSVVTQVGYFKLSGGKRIFRCAPIHHHFHLSGWSESKVVVRFWLLAMMFAAVAMALQRLR